MSNDFWPGAVIGGAVVAFVATMLADYKINTDWMKPAVNLGFGHYITDSPSSTETHWEWITNRQPAVVYVTNYVDRVVYRDVYRDEGLAPHLPMYPPVWTNGIPIISNLLNGSLIYTNGTTITNSGPFTNGTAWVVTNAIINNVLIWKGDAEHSYWTNFTEGKR